jgi:hypothetical protein
VRKVERGPLKPGVGCLRLAQREVGEVEFGGDLAGHGNHASLVVDADRLPGDTHPVAQEVMIPGRSRRRRLATQA